MTPISNPWKTTLALVLVLSLTASYAVYGLAKQVHTQGKLPHLILLMGICLSLILTGTLFLLMRSAVLARIMARGMTKDLEESRQKFQTVVATALDAIMTVDDRGLIVSWNKSAQNIFGYSESEVIGKPFLITAPARLHETYGRYFQEYLHTGTTQLLGRISELDAVRKGGREFPVEIAISGWSVGNKKFFTTIARDISERRRHEEEMKKMTIAVRQSPASIVMTDAQGLIEYVNAKFCDLTGYSAEEVLGKNPRILKSGMTAPEEYTRLWSTITSGKMWRGEFHNKKKNGEFCWVAASISPVKNSDGVITHFVGIQEDITDQKNAERLLRESEAKYRLIFESSADAIMTFDYPSGKILSANGAALKMFRVKSELDIVGVEPWILSPDLQPDGKTSTGKAMEMSEKVSHGGAFFFEWQHKRIDGEEFPATVLLTVTQLSGKMMMQASIRDVSDQKKLEKQFLQAQKMETVGTLAGGIAHDFNNLLTVINGYSQMQISALAPDDAVRADLEEILKAGKRAEELVKQLLAFSRKQVVQSKVINLQDLIQDMGKMLKRIIPENIELSVSISPDIGSVKIDPDSCQQVLTNLVVNASHAMPKGGKLTIEAMNFVLSGDRSQPHDEIAPGEYVLLTVSDTGTGMSEEVKAHLFEPFFTTKEKGKGTGLGLSTVYGIVKQSGGHIQVSSELGRGTAFKIYLPRVAAEASPWYAAENESALPRGTETVLLVEDDAGVRAFGVRILRQQGYDVLEASGGDHALRVAKEHRGNPIQALFTDMVMPGMGGKELADQFEALYPGIRVLLASGYTENIAVHSGNLSEVEAFLKKPYSPKALAHKIREVLDRKRGAPLE